METYNDGIKDFYKSEEIAEILKQAIQRKMSENDPFEGRAYLVFKELPDAKIGTVLRPAINNEGSQTEKPAYVGCYNYVSKYVGRNTFLHREIVESEESWFVRIK